jgi:hypothetical protein
MSERILDADMRTIGGWIADATRWWLAELGDLLPRNWKLGTAARTAIVPYDPDSGLFDAEETLEGKSVVVPVSLCLNRRVEQPAMNDRDLAAMIALEADRLMPLGGSGMIVAGRSLERDRDRGTMIVEVAGLARPAAELLCTRIAALGGTPRSVLVGEPIAGEPAPVDVLPALHRANLLAAAPGAARWWLAVAALFVLNVGVLIWRDVAATDGLADVVAAQQPAVDAARRIRGRIAATDRIATRTLALRDAGEPLAVLARVGAALPPGVWLQRYGWERNGLRLAGYRPAKADVTGALRSAGLASVRYEDNAAAGDNPLGQPFELTARTRGR